MKNALILTILFISAGLFYADAQVKLDLAPVAGLNFNLHNGSDLNESGNGFGMIAGGQVDLTFGRSVGMQTSLIFYDNRSGSYTETITEQGVTLTSDNSVSVAFFQIEPLLKINFPSRFFILFGPTLGFNLSAESEQELTIETPGFTFEDGSRTRTQKGTIKNTNTRFEVKAGAGFEISVADNFSIVPQVTFAYGITNVVENVDWKIMTVQALIGAKFAVL